MSTEITGIQIRDKTIDGNDLKDNIVINSTNSISGGFVVFGSQHPLVSGSALKNNLTIAGGCDSSEITTVFGDSQNSVFISGSTVFLHGFTEVTGTLDISGSLAANNIETSRMVIDTDSMDVSGTIYVKSIELYDEFLIHANFMEMTGSLTVVGGITGSLTKLHDGSSYLVAGSGVSIVTGSNGSVTISANTPANLPLTTPAIPGTIKYDQNYLYIAVDSNTWKKVSLSSL